MAWIAQPAHATNNTVLGKGSIPPPLNKEEELIHPAPEIELEALIRMVDKIDIGEEVSTQGKCFWNQTRDEEDLNRMWGVADLEDFVNKGGKKRQKEISRRYRALSKKLHSDKTDKNEREDEPMKKLNQIRDVIQEGLNNNNSIYGLEGLFRGSFTHMVGKQQGKWARRNRVENILNYLVIGTFLILCIIDARYPSLFNFLGRFQGVIFPLRRFISMYREAIRRSQF